MTPIGEGGAAAQVPEWRRLSPRVVWVDLVVSALSVAPSVIALAVTGGDVSPGAIWPLAVVAVLGVGGALADILRWAFTSFRVTGTDIERRTGIVVRRFRSVPRERVRSVDTHARLRHRLAGMRVVTVGAGQYTGTGETALRLDALSRRDADRLRRELLAGVDEVAEGPAVDVIQTFRPWWVVYNMVGVWAFFSAAGLVWGAWGIASLFGVDLFAAAVEAADWQRLGWVATVAIGLAAAAVIGAVAMGAGFLTGYWRFELARVAASGTTFLRTRQGLFTTREINRDEARARGVSISEPLLWRWMRMADTALITTGLGVWDAAAPSALVPRGPRCVARHVARRVLGDPNPLDAPLARHPRSALMRRLWWATLIAGGAVALVAAPVAAGAAPSGVLWAALAVWPLAIGLAVVSYRALGHALCGPYLVVRSGLLSRTTAALRRDAVSTLAVRQSVLQRRLGLATVSAMTAAGWYAYEAPDLAVADAIVLAERAPEGLLEPFLERGS